jgi:hypothetical protein
MKRIGLGFLAVAGLLVFVFSQSAFAGGKPVLNITQHFDDETETFNDVDPCTGAPAQITIVFDGVFHLVVQADGVGHFTETEVGTFAFDYLDENGNPDGQIDATGRFTEWDGGNGLFDEEGNPIGKAEFTFTLNGKGTRLATGESFSFHALAHATFDQLGNPKVAFEKAHCV